MTSTSIKPTSPSSPASSGAGSLSPNGGPRLPGDSDTLSLLELVNSVLRHRTMIAVVVIVLAFIAVITTLLKHPTFTSSFSFMPQQSRQAPSALSGLAAQFGVQGLAGGDPARSPAFYADLVGSRKVIDAVAHASYTFASDTGQFSGTLVQLYGGNGTDARRRERTVTELQKRISPSVVQRTGVVEVRVTTDWPTLSKQIAERVLSEIARFNLESRQSQAGAEARFTQRQLAETRDSLRAAEHALDEFSKSNREFGRASSLRFTEERLTREVVFWQQLYTNLAMGLNQSRIDEVRDTPVFTVIDAPEVPVLRNPRGLVTRTALAIMAGFVIGVVLAFARDRFGLLETSEVDAYAEFHALRRETLSDIVHPWQPLGRAMRGWRRGAT